MQFTRASIRTGGIEISQTGITQAMNAMKPGQHLLDQQLRFSIDVGRLEFIIFLNRNSLWITIQRRGGREDELSDTVGQHRFEERKSGSGVIAKVPFWHLH